MNAAPKFAAGPQRRAMIGKVKIAQKELGLDDATYRAVLSRLTGHDSAADCTEADLAKVLDEFKAKGWRPKIVHVVEKRRRTGATAARADHPAAGKARALWISLHQLGVVRDPSESALEAFAKRQLKVERLQWADQGQVYKMIEALKAMAERAGWSQSLADVPPDRHVAALKRRLIFAMGRQLLLLGKAGLAFDIREAGNLSREEGLDAIIRRGASLIKANAPSREPAQP